MFLDVRQHSIYTTDSEKHWKAGMLRRGICKEALNMKITENPDKSVVKMIKEGLEKKGGYCPCKVEKTPENKCMCKEFRDQIKDPEFEGFCHCMLYYKSRD